MRVFKRKVPSEHKVFQSIRHLRNKGSFNIDLLGMIKDLLRGLIKDMNDKAGETSDSTDPADQATVGAAAAAVALNMIEETEGNQSGLEAAVAALTEPDEASYIVSPSNL